MEQIEFKGGLVPVTFFVQDCEIKFFSQTFADVYCRKQSSA